VGYIPVSSKLIYAPDTSSLEKLFKGDITCKVTYGTEVCGKPAQWKIIMACCGASDFFCAECFQEAATTKPLFDVADYFMCSSCHKTHHTWSQAVKEQHRI
jgi:hypothetical protein